MVTRRWFVAPLWHSINAMNGFENATNEIEAL